MHLNPLHLLRDGFFFEAATSHEKLQSLASRLAPVTTNFPLIRVGGDADGGYLVPDDLKDISACFSPGVAESARFEEDLLQRFGIPSHLADFSVSAPPHGFRPKSFTKKFIATFESEQTITLGSWIHTCEDVDVCGDLICQMDIEGAEYSSFLSLDPALLRKFRIIVLEIHNIYAWANPPFFGIVEDFFRKLLSEFHVVHIHPNNNDGLIQIGPFLTPRTIEMTFLRKDRSIAAGHCSLFPHPLDFPNSPSAEDFPLPSSWIGHTATPGTNIRALLCRPRGGLNDLLCSIGLCLRYSRAHGRTLFVDTSRSGLHDSFWRYFYPVSHGDVFSLETPYSRFNLMACIPPAFHGRLESLHTEYSHSQGLFVDLDTGAPSTFDFATDFEEPLLVHEQGWTVGELISVELLAALRLSSEVKQHVLQRLVRLPKVFSAIHIRHSDYTTDYEEFLFSLRDKLAEKDVLICSDNYIAIEAAHRILDRSRLIRISSFEFSDGLPLHTRVGEHRQFELNIDSIADLIGMALSTDLYFTNVVEARRPSGFSLLAESLRRNRSIVTNLLA
jgi:hypothetical protein